MEKIVKAGLRDCTVNLDGSECAVKFDTCFRAFAVRNDGAADIYISKTSGIVPDDDGVMCVKSGASAVFAHMDIYADTVYLLGNGRVQIHAQNDSANPFNYAPTFDGGVQASGNPVQLDGLQGGVPFSEITVSGNDIIGQNLTVNVSGKNLLMLSKSTLTANGITATANDDGSITLSGTATAITYIGMWNILYARNIGVGKIAVNAIDGQSISTYFMGIDRREGSSYIDRIAQSITNNGIGEITQEDVENGRNFTVWVRVTEGCTCNNLIIYPQLEIGSTATPYEPYHGAEYTITPTSNPYVIPNGIRQQEGYNVISISEGEISVTGVRKNAALKKLWDEIDEIKTAIIVSNGETE